MKETTHDSTSSLRIKGMVCARCIEVIRAELTRAGFSIADLHLGHLTLRGFLSAEELTRVKELLTHQGFSVLDEPKTTMPTRIKAFIDAYFASDDVSENKSRLSVQLQTALGLDYDTLNGQFARAEGTTLEQYSIGRRINKVKEWLVYSDLTLTEIAYRTGYSSLQHLSNQFRQQTGLTPSHFRQIRQKKQALKQGGTVLAS